MNHDPTILVSFSDLVVIARASKQKILIGALFFACLTCTYLLTKPITYEAQATFREKVRSQSGVNTNQVTSVFLTPGNNDSNEAISTMKSRYILERVINKLGLNASIARNQFRFPTLANIRDNLIAEYASLRNRSGPLFFNAQHDISAKDVSYLREEPLSLQLNFISEDEFQFSGPENISGGGKIGVPVSMQYASFTITRENNLPLTSQEFLLTFEPTHNILHSLLNNIKIATHRDDKTLLTLKYAHSERQTASDVLNAIMLAYQDYLKQEQEHILSEQVQYLQSRHENMQEGLHKMMVDHAATLSSDVAVTGFPDTNKAMDFLAMRQAEYSKELLSIDLELKRLHKAQQEGTGYYERYAVDGPSVINKILTEMRLLKQQSDSIELALTRSLNKTQGTQEEHEDTTQPFLRGQEAQHHEFQGINLETAQELYVEYGKQLNILESEVLQQYFVLDQMKNPEFEISSLSTILTDSVSKEMIKKASTLLLSIRDDHNRSAKEQERLKNELSIQKGFLALHLQQSLQLLQLKENLWKEKIQSILNITLNLINKEIAILQEQMNAYMRTRIENLQQERGVIQQHQQLIQLEMAKLPNKWVSERLIDQQMDMNKKMVEEITRLVENKNISSNLELVQSAPVDSALSGIQPQPPRILFFMLISALLGGFLTFCFSVAQAMINGVQATADNLTLSQQFVAGTLSAQYQQESKQPLLDHDLETLRRLIIFMENAVATKDNSLLLLGQGPDYAQDLARLIAKKGLTAILLPIAFDEANEGSQPGLLQYLEGDVSRPAVIETKGYDYIPPGGICRYANEFIGTRRFLDLLHTLQQEYDWVIVISRAKSHSAEAENLLRIFNNAVITVTDQTWYDLKSCMETADSSARRAFVLTNLPVPVPQSVPVCVPVPQSVPVPRPSSLSQSQSQSQS